MNSPAIQTAVDNISQGLATVNPASVDPGKVGSDAEKYYLSQGGNQAAIDAYNAQGKTPEQKAQDAVNWYTDSNRTDTNTGEAGGRNTKVLDYAGYQAGKGAAPVTPPPSGQNPDTQNPNPANPPAPPTNEQPPVTPPPPYDPYQGTNIKPDGVVSNTGEWAPGSGAQGKDPWTQPESPYNPDGSLKPGYGMGPGTPASTRIINGQTVNIPAKPGQPFKWNNAAGPQAITPPVTPPPTTPYVPGAGHAPRGPDESSRDYRIRIASPPATPGATPQVAPQTTSPATVGAITSPPGMPAQNTLTGGPVG